jgi:hypothetical protein
VCLGVDLLQANSASHLFKLGLAERLGQDVGELISSRNMLSLDASILQTTADKVILNSVVPASFMEDWILG